MAQDSAASEEGSETTTQIAIQSERYGSRSTDIQQKFFLIFPTFNKIIPHTADTEILRGDQEVEEQSGKLRMSRKKSWRTADVSETEGIDGKARIKTSVWRRGETQRAIYPEPPRETQLKCVNKRVWATNQNTASRENKNQSDVITGSDTRVPFFTR